MLRFFQSIFRRRAPRSGAYSESLVKAAIERAVDGTDPWIRAVSGYRKKLRPAVLHAIDHVVALVDDDGSLLALDMESYESDPILRTFFISQAEMRAFLASEPRLSELREGRGASHRATGLLVMEKKEKVILGAALSGDVVMRDVPQVAVSFERHRLMDLSVKEDETLYQLKKRAYDHLLRIALGRITALKTRRGTLEKHRTLLSSKLAFLKRGGFGFDQGSGEKLDAASIEATLAQIEGQLLELGKDDKMLEVYLQVVVDVLSRAEEHLWVKRERLVLDRMGIKQQEPGGGSREVALDVMGDAEGRSLVVALVSIPL